MYSMYYYIYCCVVFCKFAFLCQIYSLFVWYFNFLATDALTVYIFQEPSMLSSLQDSGLTDVVLHALLVKEVCLQAVYFYY